MACDLARSHDYRLGLAALGDGRLDLVAVGAGRVVEREVVGIRDTWYVAGINGTNDVKTLTFDLSFISGQNVSIFADTAKKPWDIRTSTTLPTSMECQPRGGFVLVVR